MESLDQFKVNKPTHHCSLCGKEITRYSMVSIRLTDPTKTYRNTGRPMLNSYKFILCPDHFGDFKAMMGKFIKDNAKKKEEVSEYDDKVAKVHADFDEIDQLLD
jgi:hypothetical protein